jgi:hypothetical protein
MIEGYNVIPTVTVVELPPLEFVPPWRVVGVSWLLVPDPLGMKIGMGKG